MKTIHLLVLSVMCILPAHADFSYTQTRKSAGGMAGGAMSGMNPITKHYLKGQKMKTDMGGTAILMDFEEQTITHINNDQKTYTVTKFSDVGQVLKDTSAEISVDVKETGQRKNINGFNASQVIMTMNMEGMPGAPAGAKMQFEMELWISPDVPGAQEARRFFQKNGDRMALAVAGGPNPQMQKSMAAMQRRVGTLGGVAVMQIVRMKAAGAGGPSDAQMAQGQTGMAEAMARMQEMRKQGGPQAQAAEQAMARMQEMRKQGGPQAQAAEQAM